MSPTSTAQSFSLSLQAAQKTGQAAQIKTFRRAFVEALRSQKTPTTLIVFVSGAPTLASNLADEVAEAAPGLRALVIPAAGVLTEAAELEGVPAVAGLLWSSGTPKVEADDAALAPTKATRLVLPPAMR